jgi:hypothetical protein
VLDSTGHDDELARTDLDHAVAELEPEAPADAEE